MSSSKSREPMKSSSKLDRGFRNRGARQSVRQLRDAEDSEAMREAGVPVVESVSDSARLQGKHRARLQSLVPFGWDQVGGDEDIL